MSFHIPFRSKMSFAFGQKYYVRNWTVTKLCDIRTGDFRFSFSAEKGISFIVGIFVYGWKWKMYFRSAYTSNCFRLHPTPMIFKHSTIQVLDSLIIIIIIIQRRLVRRRNMAWVTTRAPKGACRCLEKIISFMLLFDTSSSSSSSPSSSSSRSPSDPLRSQSISDLQSVDSSRALASSWILLSQTLRGRHGGLLQLAFLPSWVSTIRRRASCAGTPGFRRPAWPNTDKSRWRKMSPMVDKPDRWSTSALETWTHQRISYIKYLSLTPHLESLQCIHVGDQVGLCFCTLEQKRPYQCLLQVYFGADTEITAISYPR